MGYHITIRQGNLLEAEAEFIVNASNTRLILGSGVSMAFKRHCGIGLQAEMDAALQAIGEPLSAGDVVATSSGEATNFRYALHAAIMDYNPGVRPRDKAPTLETVRLALEQIEAYLLRYARHHDRVRVALPLLGCGVGGLPREEVIDLYRDFFDRDVAMTCCVILYGHTPEDYRLIRQRIGESAPCS